MDHAGSDVHARFYRVDTILMKMKFYKYTFMSDGCLIKEDYPMQRLREFTETKDSNIIIIINGRCLNYLKYLCNTDHSIILSIRINCP